MQGSLFGAVSVRRRFLRSVHLERDFYAPGATDGYVPTPVALATLRRVLAGVRTPAARAFSITGAYGSGKSAFALVLAKSLSAAPWGDPVLREAAETETGETLFDAPTVGLFPVLIVGGREPIGVALVNGLRRALRTAGVSPELPDVPGEPTGAQVAAFYEAASARLCEAVAGVRGLLVVVDEAGKFLEYAALHPEAGDLQGLQEMAEAAVRSPKNAPLLFVSVFHQAFDEYAGQLGARERGEWRKVQGRFADMAFADAPEETLRLVARAMERPPDVNRDAAMREEASRAAEKAAGLGVLPRGVTQAEFANLADATYPLHPMTLLALPHVFRRFGQGERSLFAFLAGDEPGGLGDFLLAGTGLYTLDRLYDYLLSSVSASALNSAGSGSAMGRLWSETQEAVERAKQSAALPALAAPVAKIIGLLHVLEGSAVNLSASEGVIVWAMDAPAADAAKAVMALSAATLIQYRRHKNAFKPYAGSDVDIEELLREARSSSPAESLDVTATAARLAALGATDAGDDAETSAATALLPVVARRHLFETGTLRLFEQVMVRPERLTDLPGRGANAAYDGTIVLCLARDPSEANASTNRAQSVFADRAEVLCAVLTETERLREAARTADNLLAIRAAHNEIDRDRVARREWRERFADAQTAFESEWERLVSGASGSHPWLYRGAARTAGNARARQQLVSEACEQTYPHTPRLPNELVNRRALTGVAAAGEGVATPRAGVAIPLPGLPFPVSNLFPQNVAAVKVQSAVALG